VKRLDYTARTDISEVVWNVIRRVDGVLPPVRDFRRAQCVKHLGPYAQGLADARHPLIDQQMDDGGGWSAGLRLLALEFLLDLYEDGEVMPGIEAWDKQQPALAEVKAKLDKLLRGI